MYQLHGSSHCSSELLSRYRIPGSLVPCIILEVFGCCEEQETGTKVGYRPDAGAAGRTRSFNWRKQIVQD